MKGVTKFIGITILLLLIVQAVSASFSVNSLQINPTGTLLPGDSVNLAFTIQMPSGSTTANDLRLYTALDKPKWSYAINVNGIKTAPGEESTKSVDISSFLLTYKSGDDVSVSVTLDGTVPSVTSTTTLTLIQVTEIGTSGSAIDSTKYLQTATVVNTAEVASAISQQTSDLQALRTHIDEKAAMDIDTSAAEAKYNEAQQKISAAQALPSNQYTTAQTYLTAAQTAITDGETLLDKAWAEQAVADAQVSITNVDNKINYFKGNSSTANDAKLSPIIAKREVAASYISAANDAISAGNFAQARAKAADAFTKGDEAYNDALVWQKQVESGWNPFAGIGKLFSSSVVIIVVGLIAAVLVVVGVIIYRKRSRWDELG
jgi:hypothetical protein